MIWLEKLLVMFGIQALQLLATKIYNIFAVKLMEHKLKDKCAEQVKEIKNDPDVNSRAKRMRDLLNQ